MKKIIILGIVLPFLFFLLPGCQKDDSFPSEANPGSANGFKGDAFGGCWLTSYTLYDGIGDVTLADHFTYKDGLLENVWPNYEGWRFNMVYDAKKRLAASNVYLDEMLVGLVEFTYENNKPVLETWLHPETRAVEDEVVYTYNQQGYLVRTESLMFGFYTDYTYTIDGNLQSNHVFLGGLPWFRADYTYEGNHKNPYRSVPGLQLQFWYTNSGFGSGREWYTSEKITLYDENGDPFILYEQDATKTTWQSAAQHYPLVASYVDMHTQAPITNTFEYENCVPGQPSTSASARSNRGARNKAVFKGKRPIFGYPSEATIESIRQTQSH